jgi:hypothetical protein
MYRIGKIHITNPKPAGDVCALMWCIFQHRPLATHHPVLKQSAVSTKFICVRKAVKYILFEVAMEIVKNPVTVV